MLANTLDARNGKSGMALSELDLFLGRMNPILDVTLERLAQKKFRPDPIGGNRYSRITSIMSSAYKRHGQILGRALLERLKDCGRFQVWTEERFHLSHRSNEALARGLPPVSYRAIDLPYGEAERVIPIDLLVYEPALKRLRTYNVSRGNGAYDAGKKRLVVGEMLRTQMHLRDHARGLGLKVETAEAFVVSYYGLRAAPAPFSLIAEELDDHFQFPVHAAIEALNAEFKARLHDLIDEGAGFPLVDQVDRQCLVVSTAG